MISRVAGSFDFDRNNCAHLSGVGRQKRAPAIPGFELPVDDPGQAVHLYDAHET